jgi:RNA polymerase sigma-70 factor (ECF subfamily)
MPEGVHPGVVGAGRPADLVAAVRLPHPDQVSDFRATRAAGATAATSDPELHAIVLRAQGGDHEAQSELVRRYTRRVFGQVSVIVRQTSAIEDVVQMAFIKMVRALPWLRDPRVFEPWLFTLSRSTALDFIRRQRCRPVTVAAELELINIADSDSDSEQAIAEIMEALELALRHVGAKDRRLIALLLQGHDYRALADAEKLSVGAVKARLSRVRTFLRVAVGKETGRRLPSPDEINARPRCRLAA